MSKIKQYMIDRLFLIGVVFGWLLAISSLQDHTYTAEFRLTFGILIIIISLLLWFQLLLYRYNERMNHDEQE